MSRLLHAFLLALLPAISLADVVVPDTPAGRAFSAFLDTINRADAEHQGAFLQDHPSWMTLESLADWSAGTGGYELLEVSSSDPTNLFFRVKQKRWAVEEVGRLEVSAADPKALEVLGMWRIPAGARFEPSTLDEATRARVIKFAAAAYESSYVDPGIGRQMAAALRKSAARGEYRAVRYGDILASKLTKQLRQVSHDQHVEVRFRYFVPRAESPAEQTGEAGRRRDVGSWYLGSPAPGEPRPEGAAAARFGRFVGGLGALAHGAHRKRRRGCCFDGRGRRLDNGAIAVASSALQHRLRSDRPGIGRRALRASYRTPEA